jgi:hypothetical protein
VTLWRPRGALHGAPKSRWICGTFLWTRLDRASFGRHNTGVCVLARLTKYCRNGGPPAPLTHRQPDRPEPAVRSRAIGADRPLWRSSRRPLWRPQKRRYARPSRRRRHESAALGATKLASAFRPPALAAKDCKRSCKQGLCIPHRSRKHPHPRERVRSARSSGRRQRARTVVSSSPPPPRLGRAVGLLPRREPHPPPPGGISWVLSWRLPPVSAHASGIPPPSTSR